MDCKSKTAHHILRGWWKNYTNDQDNVPLMQYGFKLLLDNKGNVWPIGIGFFKDGFGWYDGDKWQKLLAWPKVFAISSYLLDSNGNLWIGSSRGGGVYKIKP